MAAQSVNISVSDSQIARLRADLNPKQFKQALFQTVNRTTNFARTRVREVVKEKTYMKPKYVNRAIAAKVTKTDPPVGVVTVSQRLVPLVGFKVSATKAGVTAQVSKNKPAIKLKHGFRARVKSFNQKADEPGHLGIFLRSKHLPTKGPNIGKGKLTKRGRAGRLAIEEQFGASVLQLVEQKDLIEPLTKDINAQLEKNLQSQLDRFLK